MQQSLEVLYFTVLQQLCCLALLLIWATIVVPSGGIGYVLCTFFHG